MIKQLFIVFFSLQFFNCLAQKNIQLTGHISFIEKINDVWGYENSNGESYALVGGESGFHIVDISTPNTPDLIFTISGDTSIWRDVKTYNDFAYVTNEENGGLLIVDLSNLPLSAPYQYVSQIDSFNFQTAHNIFIDENGFAYLLGSNIGNQGAFIIDLNTTNRFAPTFSGMYDNQYVHDAYIRGDTLYTAEINNGTFSIVDVADKSNPIVIARHETSRNYTHNLWLSDDGDYLITTDEKAGAYVDLYDISNLNNIQLLDKYQRSPNDSVIPHNTFFKGDYILTSYYRDGISIVDASNKRNLVEIGNYDTSPYSSASGFEGNWGVYPYLSNGLILASDREEGLFILSPQYKRASYLSGAIFDTLNNLPISNAQVELIGTDYLKYSQFNGSYNIGAVDSGFYDLRISHPRCRTVIETNILLETGIEKLVNLETSCAFATPTHDLGTEPLIKVSQIEEQNTIYIQVAASDLLEYIHILDVNGQTIKTISVQNTQLDLHYNNKLATGIYFIEFVFTHTKQVKKILKY